MPNTTNHQRIMLFMDVISNELYQIMKAVPHLRELGGMDEYDAHFLLQRR